MQSLQHFILLPDFSSPNLPPYVTAYFATGLDQPVLQTHLYYL